MSAVVLGGKLAGDGIWCGIQTFAAAPDLSYSGIMRSAMRLTRMDRYAAGHGIRFTHAERNIESDASARFFRIFNVGLSP
jgi:hypothetical protein